MEAIDADKSLLSAGTTPMNPLHYDKPVVVLAHGFSSAAKPLGILLSFP